jgi:hypothetical protein
VLTLTWTELERNNTAGSSHSAKGSGRMAEFRYWNPCTRPNAISQQLHRGAEKAASNTGLSALTAVYAVGSTMTTLGAHVCAKVQRSVAWVRLHKLDDHRSCANGAMRGRHGRQPFFRSHLISFESGSIKACEVRCSRDNQNDQKGGDDDRRDEPAYNFVALRPARGHRLHSPTWRLLPMEQP